MAWSTPWCFWTKGCNKYYRIKNTVLLKTILYQIFAWFHIDSTWIWVLVIQNLKRSLLTTCSRHIFTNSKSTNFTFFSRKIILFSFKRDSKCLFLWKWTTLITFFLNRKILLCFKKNCGFILDLKFGKYVTNMFKYFCF